MPTGVKHEGKQVPAWRILDVGSLPFQVENADGTVTVTIPVLTRATLLDVNGMPTETPVEFRQSSGMATAKLPANTMYLLLSAGGPKP